jgi:aryl-alcohol dehydrogenase-like predicted oxidoreductase
MRFRRLGRTGLNVSALCLGSNTFGWTTDEAASFAVLDAYAEAGGNCVDTADIYCNWIPGNSGGESESIIGAWLSARKNRANMLIGTKVYFPMGPGANNQGLTRHHIMQAVEASLSRLRTDYLDLYVAHDDDLLVPQDETMRAFDDLVRQGKVRYIGASGRSRMGTGYTVWRLVRALWTADRLGAVPYSAVGVRYNLYDRPGYEGDMEALCRDQDLRVLTNVSLANGFLSGKYRPGARLPHTERAQTVAQRYMDDRGQRILAELDIVAAESGASLAQIALAWILARPTVTAPIASATTVDQLHELIGGTELSLTQDAVDRLNRI